MAKTYEIFKIEDLGAMYSKIINYQQGRVNRKLPFEKMNIVVKKYRKPKSSSQHRSYWRCIGELKKAMYEVGNIYSNDELHELIKIQSGFTRSIDLPNGRTVVITKSISDGSDDINSENINFLIDFVINFSRDFLGYEIEIN